MTDLVAEALEWLQNRMDAATSDEEREAIKRATLAVVARDGDGVASFDAFYYLVHGHHLPKHAIPWIEAIFEAKEKGKKGVVIKAFRGSWKTTTLTITYTAWWMGRNPADTVLLIQVGDDIAGDNTQAIATMIRDNPGFKLAFPHVIPNEKAGWGAGGYNIKDNRYDDTAWAGKTSHLKDPSLLGAGYRSREVIGKHPGLLIVDDIHDENNTKSEREMQTVRQILTGTIFPTMRKDTTAVFVGTPWKENDVLAYVESTGAFVRVVTPVYDADGNLAFPEVMGADEIEMQKSLAGSVEFARMYLLDLTASRNKTFKYQLYPNQQIGWDWVMVTGVDYAGSMDEWKNQMGLGDFFAIAYLLKLPQGGAVVVDGILDRCTQAQAEAHVVKCQNLFANLQIAVVEGDGRGEDLIQVLKRNPTLRIMPMKTGGKSKAERLEKHMGPWLENGMLRISDAETEFLVELRRELDSYPSHNHDDAMDALYWAFRGMPDVFRIPKDIGDGTPDWAKSEKSKNPFTALAQS